MIHRDKLAWETDMLVFVRLVCGEMRANQYYWYDYCDAGKSTLLNTPLIRPHAD